MAFSAPFPDLHNGVFTGAIPVPANASEENVYIKSLKVNGKPWNSAILPHSEIASGGLMEFELSSEASGFGESGL